MSYRRSIPPFLTFRINKDLVLSVRANAASGPRSAFQSPPSRTTEATGPAQAGTAPKTVTAMLDASREAAEAQGAAPAGTAEPARDGPGERGSLAGLRVRFRYVRRGHHLDRRLQGIERLVGDAGLVEMTLNPPLDHFLGDARGLPQLMMDYYLDRPFFDRQLAFFGEYSMALLKASLEQGVRAVFHTWYYASMSAGWSPAIRPGRSRNWLAVLRRDSGLARNTDRPRARTARRAVDGGPVARQPGCLARGQGLGGDPG